jgi:hypothetical protein
MRRTTLFLAVILLATADGGDRPVDPKLSSPQQSV